MGDAIADGMTLIFSIWNDAGGNMTWLDTGNAGPCSTSEGELFMKISSTMRSRADVACLQALRVLSSRTIRVPV